MSLQPVAFGQQEFKIARSQPQSALSSRFKQITVSENDNKLFETVTSLIQELFKSTHGFYNAYYSFGKEYEKIYNKYVQLNKAQKVNEISDFIKKIGAMFECCIECLSDEEVLHISLNACELASSVYVHVNQQYFNYLNSTFLVPLLDRIYQQKRKINFAVPRNELLMFGAFMAGQEKLALWLLKHKVSTLILTPNSFYNPWSCNHELTSKIKHKYRDVFNEAAVFEANMQHLTQNYRKEEYLSFTPDPLKEEDEKAEQFYAQLPERIGCTSSNDFPPEDATPNFRWAVDTKPINSYCNANHFQKNIVLLEGPKSTNLPQLYATLQNRLLFADGTTNRITTVVNMRHPMEDENPQDSPQYFPTEEGQKEGVWGNKDIQCLTAKPKDSFGIIETQILLEGQHIKYIRIPHAVDNSIMPKGVLVELVERLSENDGVTAVHCKAGRGRTGFVVIAAVALELLKKLPIHALNRNAVARIVTKVRNSLIDVRIWCPQKPQQKAYIITELCSWLPQRRKWMAEYFHGSR